MLLLQALLYLTGIVLITLGAFRIGRRVSLPLLGGAALALGYFLPAIAAAI